MTVSMVSAVVMTRVMMVTPPQVMTMVAPMAVIAYLPVGSVSLGGTPKYR